MRTPLAVVGAMGALLLTGCATSAGGGPALAGATETAPQDGEGRGPLTGLALELAPGAQGRDVAIYESEPEPPHPSPLGYEFDASIGAKWAKQHPVELRITNGVGTHSVFLAFEVQCKAAPGWGPSGIWTWTGDDDITTSATDPDGSTTTANPAGSLEPGTLTEPAMGCLDDSAGRGAVESLVHSPLHYFASQPGTLWLSDGTTTLWFALADG